VSAATGRLRVSAAVAGRHPGYAALALYVHGLRNGPSDAQGADALARAAAEARAAFGDAGAASHPHIRAWREAYAAFGAKPSRFPCSAEALLKRALRGDDPPRVNRAVDAYNAVSIAFALPIGGEDLDRLDGVGELKVADGGEPFVAFHDGAEAIEHPEPGEIVWADAQGVTCRRWSWRQCRRTQLTEATTAAYFLLERLPPLPLERLLEAGAELTSALRAITPDVAIEPERLGPGWERAA
jgi:DNA/RNA-binding domain of Phe-tRNA-synthetase-like protein